jgi:hypothetical protein
MRRFAFIAAAAFAVGNAKGDMPLPPPSEVTATSPSGGIRAISDPKGGTRIEDVKKGKVLWRLPEWHRSMRVADDGKHLVTESDGMNLIPVDFTDDFVLLTFWRDGTKIRDITVGDLFPDHLGLVFPDHLGLVRTASHYVWRLTIDFDAHGLLRVSLMNGRTLLFDVSTGNFIENLTNR